MLKTSKPAIFISLFVGLLLIFSERNLSDPKIILIWFGTLHLVSPIWIKLISIYQSTPDANVQITNARLMIIHIGIFLSGIIWGSIGILFFPITVNLFLDEISISSDMGIAVILYFRFLVILGRFINATIIQCTILQYKAEASEKEARISEERYRLIFQHSPAGIVHYNKELVITYYNDRFAEVMKAPRKQLIGFDINTLKDQRLVPLLRKAIEGEEGSYEGEYLSSLGNTQLWIIMSYVPVRNADSIVEGVIAIIEDITVQIHYQNRLQKSEENKVVFANEAYLRLIKADISTILGKNLKDDYAN